MINRVLIRIKVIQILYSYLLVEKKFTLEEAPDNPTKEKRYAYRLYIDILALLVMVSERISGKYSLMSTRFIERVAKDDQVHAAKMRLQAERVLSGTADHLAEEIKESGTYKMFLKDSKNNADGAEELMWKGLLTRIVMPDPEVIRYAESIEGYTLKGLERTEGMLETTLTNFMASQDTLDEGLAALRSSLDKTRELYFRLLQLAVELTELQDRRLDNARHRHLRTEEDLNPNMRFVENRAVQALKQDEDFRDYIDGKKINWLQEDPLLMDHLLKAVLESETYVRYMEAPDTDMRRDAELWRELFRKVIFVNPFLLESLEESSVYWNDDIDIIGTFVIKTFRRIEEGAGVPVLSDYKDDEDRAFGPLLMTRVYQNKEAYADMIREAVADSGWEAERLAFMDTVIIQAALAEIMFFPKIPLSVSINEYIEIAKSYSSAKSGQFVNGLLGCLIKRLQEENRLFKK